MLGIAFTQGTTTAADETAEARSLVFPLLGERARVRGKEACNCQGLVALPGVELCFPLLRAVDFIGSSQARWIAERVFPFTPALSPRRGRTVRCAFDNRQRLDSSRCGMGCSHSLSERAGVRAVLFRPPFAQGLHLLAPGGHSFSSKRKLVGRFLRLFGAALLGWAMFDAAQAEEKITYQDHVLPLIESNCGKCHNPDKKKGDLDLTSYSGALKGGGSGPVVVARNPDSSKLWRAITHAEDPTMPPNKPKLPDKELEVFREWIAGGLLETTGSKAIAANKPTVDLTLSAASVGKPDGPPPM